MRKYFDGIFCGAVTVIYTSLFTTVFETLLSMPLVRESRKVTNICLIECRKARREFLERLRIDYFIQFSLVYNGAFTVCKTVGTHYGDMLFICIYIHVSPFVVYSYCLIEYHNEGNHLMVRLSSEFV